MYDLKCPYCPARYPDMLTLAPHVHQVHADLNLEHRLGELNRITAFGTTDPRQTSAPTLTCAACEGPDPSHGGLTTHRGTRENCSGPDCGPRHVVLCVCGLMIEPYDNDTEFPGWSHATYPTNGCKVAVPAAGMPTKQDRKDLLAEWSRVGVGLDKAQSEMRDLREQFDSVDRRLAALDRHLTSPATVRRATLNQVWDRLVDKGQMQAANIVMDMIRRVVPDQ